MGQKNQLEVRLDSIYKNFSARERKEISFTIKIEIFLDSRSGVSDQAL